MNSMKRKKGKESSRQSPTTSEDEEETFNVPLSLAEEDVNMEHDMVVSSFAKPKRPAASNQSSQNAAIQQNQSQSSIQVSPSFASRPVQPRTATTTSAFQREEVLSELQERLTATLLEETPDPSQGHPAPDPSQSQPTTRPPRSFRSLRLSAGRRELNQATASPVPSEPVNEDSHTGHVLDKLAGMIRADPNAWPTTAVCMALHYPQSRPKIMPRYSKEFWENAAEAIYGPTDQ